MKMRTALVIVHLSSIDSYAFHVGAVRARRLADAIIATINSHDGPVFIVDQNWEGPIRDRVVAATSQRAARRIYFDEDVHDWNRFLPSLERQLRRARVTDVIVGGVWFDPNLQTGCATEVYLYLRSRFKVVVDPTLVGCETDSSPMDSGLVGSGELHTELAAIAEAHESYLYGRCETFAIAMHRVSGLPIYGVTGYDADVERYVLVHAYVRLNADTIIDIKGPRSYEAMLEDFADDAAAHEDTDESEFTEKDIAKMGTGSSRCPPLREVTPVAKRVWEIARQLDH